MNSNDKPVIAVLGGTGKEGSALALRWAHAGYRVILGSRTEERANAVAAELNRPARRSGAGSKGWPTPTPPGRRP